jgi:hypothetical protein
MKPILVRSVLAVTLSALLLTGTPVAEAGIITTSEAVTVEAGIARSAQIDRVNAFLAREDVRERLTSWGVDPVDAAKRVAAMTDAELVSLSRQIDEAPAGGNILALIGAVFVVLLILDYVGVTKVFRR